LFQILFPFRIRRPRGSTSTRHFYYPDVMRARSHSLRCKLIAIAQFFWEQGSNLIEVQRNGTRWQGTVILSVAGEPRQSTCLTTDECRGWPDSRPQKVNSIQIKELHYPYCFLILIEYVP
jgi:hypothetical protein